jgi:hypothetical protein
MESRSVPKPGARSARILVFDPEGKSLAEMPLSGGRLSVGRLADANDIALQPDPQRLVTRVAHCTVVREGDRFAVVDGGSVNGTFLERGGELERVVGHSPLKDGDVICVLAAIADDGTRTFFRLAFRSGADSQATRAVAVHDAKRTEACLRYEPAEARLVLVSGAERHEIEIRAQAHLLVAHMSGRNEAIDGAPALCTHEELMHAVWGDEPMHTRAELAKLIWELRKKLEPFGAEHLIVNERRRGYRLRTCPPDA